VGLVEGWLDGLGPLYAALVSLAIIVVMITAVVAIYIRQRWRAIFDKACADAFAKTDTDKSGCIDKNELYVGVLEMYLQLHLYGLNVRSPPRAKVEKLMEAVDEDRSGTLVLEEFKQVLEALVGQTFSRVCTQIGLTILCPMIASHIAAGLRWSASSVMVAGGLEVPNSARAIGSYLPPSLDETLLTTVLMLSINPALSMTDNVVEDLTVAKTKQKAY